MYCDWCPKDGGPCIVCGGGDRHPLRHPGFWWRVGILAVVVAACAAVILWSLLS